MSTSTNISIKPHTLKQEQAFFCEKRILLVGTGTQWGKTLVGALRMKQKVHTFTDKEDNFLITSPTYKTMVQSTLPPFLKYMEGHGRYHQKHECFEVYGGGKVWFRTETDPDSIVGITNVRHIWGDEAGKYRLYFWENIQARADFCGATIDLTTSPYSLNWVYREIIKPWRRGKRREDLEIVQAASWENPYHSLHDDKRRLEKMATMDSRRFKMLYGGEWDQIVGAVYDCWDDDQNLVDAFQLPTGTRFVAGIDWGYFPDPFALKIRAITPDGKHYGISEFVKTQQTISDIVDICKRKLSVYPDIEMFYCDPSQPGYIEELNRAKIPAKGARNDIRHGIDLHYELIKTRRYKEFRGACPHTSDELTMYHYPEPEDLGPDDSSKELLPVDASNHCLDLDRYITLETFHTTHKLAPKRPEEEVKPINDQHRHDILKRNPRRTREKWS